MSDKCEVCEGIVRDTCTCLLPWETDENPEEGENNG
jgi:hypothetical protein